MRSSSAIVLFLISIIANPGIAQPRQVESNVYATFERAGPNVNLIGLAVGDLKQGAKVILKCSGPSCPFASRTMNADGNIKMLAITDMFVDTVFKPGTTIEVRVIQAGATGKVYKYDIEAAGEPKVTKLCLAPGAENPTACG